LDILSHQGWKIVTAGFEAATIGGFADWFAVSASMKFQFPLSASIQTLSPKIEKKLTEGIVDLVTNKWLSPDVIAEN
jgi:uncharacterized membrane-anchored protein YjiN (DUF445 family)